MEVLTNADCKKKQQQKTLHLISVSRDTSVIKCTCKRKKVMKLSSARHKSIPDHEQIFSHKLCTDQVICCYYWFREGDDAQTGKRFFHE